MPTSMKSALSQRSKHLAELAGWRVFGLGLGLMLSGSCHADGAAIAKTGLGAAPACQTCHGAAGEGVAQAGFPAWRVWARATCNASSPPSLTARASTT
jgi:hypothetical protein